MKVKEFVSTDKDGNEVEVSFVRPKQSVLSRGDFIYRSEFSNAIRAGIMTSAEASKLLRDRGIWDDEKEALEIDIRREISSLELQLKDLGFEEGQPVYQELKKKRDELNSLTKVFSSVSDNTAESVASEVRTQFFASECSVYKNSGKKVFKSFDDFKSRLDERIAADCYRNAMISSWEDALGISIDELSDSLAEDEWLMSFKEDEPDVDKEQEEEAEEVKPKKTRRRRKKAEPAE